MSAESNCDATCSRDPWLVRRGTETLSHKVKRMKTAQQIEHEMLLHGFKRKLNVQDDTGDDGAVPTTTENIHGHQRQREQAPANSGILNSFKFKNKSGGSSSNKMEILNPMVQQEPQSTTIIDPGGLRAPGGSKAKKPCTISRTQ